MRVLGSAVLALEWIVLGLAVPVAVNTSDVSPVQAWVVFLLGTLLTVAALMTLPRRVGVWLGWAVQGVAIAGGLVVPMLAIVGAIFAALYLAAVRLAARVDEFQAAQQALVPSADVHISQPAGSHPAGEQEEQSL